MDYYDLLDEIYDIDEESGERIPLLEQVIREADLARDLPTGVEARELLISSCLFAGFPKKQLAAFSWLVNLYETTENLVNVYDLLWHYKWIADGIVHFSDISLTKIQDLTADMKAKLKEHNYSLRPYYKVKMLQAITIGNVLEAEENFALWQSAKADFMNDCQACETTEVVGYYHFIGDNEKAIEAAAPILNGSQSCAEVPHLTYGHTALAYLQLNQLEEAQKSFKLGYPLVKKHAPLISTVAQFIDYLVQIGDNQQAVKIYQENKVVVEGLESDIEKLHFYLSSTGIDFSGIAEVSAKEVAEIREKAGYYAKRFDQRDENNYYQSLLMTK